jgi:hypothetical protein
VFDDVMRITTRRVCIHFNTSYFVFVVFVFRNENEGGYGPEGDFFDHATLRFSSFSHVVGKHKKVMGEI